MTGNLWSSNSPANFWQVEPRPAVEEWQTAVARALPVLQLPLPQADLDTALAYTLGEEQFGAGRWRLSPVRRLYYTLKPFLPRALTRLLRRATSRPMEAQSQLGWPIEDRYALFVWEVLRQLLQLRGQPALSFRYFWPEGRTFALVLTHDVETDVGQAFVRRVVELEESLGFRSSFNFVPERYTLDVSLMDELRERGFEIGVHGLKHDGKLFWSEAEFKRRAARINRYLDEFNAAGFRTPLTHRNAEWMQALNMGYDLSFFDTDPYEPMPGGTMSIWPFDIGHFLELPYTLVQDYTLTSVLAEETPRLWLEKVDFIRQYHGMALLNTHPDYLQEARTWEVYARFLQAMAGQGGFWHGLPCDLAAWWRDRAAPEPDAPGLVSGQARLEAGVLVVGTGRSVAGMATLPRWQPGAVTVGRERYSGD